MQWRTVELTATKWSCPNPYTWVSSDYGAEVGHMYQLFLWSCAFSVRSITIWCVFLDEVIIHQFFSKGWMISFGLPKILSQKIRLPPCVCVFFFLCFHRLLPRAPYLFPSFSLFIIFLHLMGVWSLRWAFSKFRLTYKCNELIFAEIIQFVTIEAITSQDEAPDLHGYKQKKEGK